MPVFQLLARLSELTLLAINQGKYFVLATPAGIHFTGKKNYVLVESKNC